MAVAVRARKSRLVPDRENLAGPIVKWVGGKTKLLSELTRRMPPTYRRYYEPFVGGAALFFRIAPDRAVLADVNQDLVGLYRAVASDVDGVIRRLQQHRDKHDERHYYDMRTRWNDRDASWHPAERAAAFIYLNKTCFNGLWRVNRSGAFNVPIGRYTDPPICVPEALKAASNVLARADLRNVDYRLAVSDAARGELHELFGPRVHVRRSARARRDGAPARIARREGDAVEQRHAVRAIAISRLQDRAREVLTRDQFERRQAWRRR